MIVGEGRATRIKYGFVLPGGDAPIAAKLARLAERSGWDGFFVWDPVWGVDPWMSLTAAMLTRRIRLGTMLTPVSRYRPWQLAQVTACQMAASYWPWALGQSTPASRSSVR